MDSWAIRVLVRPPHFTWSLQRTCPLSTHLPCSLVFYPLAPSPRACTLVPHMVASWQFIPLGTQSAWKKDPQNEDLMVPRGIGDTDGDYYDVYEEGYIDGYDGMDIRVKRPTWGLDFNRNYPYGWNSEFRQQGAGPYPLSNPETKAVVDFVNAHPNIGAVLTHHTSGGMLLTPPGTMSESKAPKYDMNVFEQLGKVAEKKMGYKKMNIFDSFLSDQENYDSGAFDDWCYETHGIYAITLELWNLEERAGCPMVYNKKEDLLKESERTAACYRWIKENCPGQIRFLEDF